MASKNGIFCHTFLQKQGKCKCPGYVENPSKWSKGKCKRCTHPKTMHTGFMEENNANDINCKNDEEQKQEQQLENDDNNSNNDNNDEQEED